MRRAFLLVVVALFALVSGCPPAEPASRAFQVSSRSELIGGPRALGEVGDFMLENDKVRFVVQDAGFSRGFGVFGGALLDADLVRPENGRGDSAGGRGLDNFGEMFPAFFLEALEPIEQFDSATGTTRPAIEVENPGGPGQPAVIVVRGIGGDFLALTQSINEALLGDDRQIQILEFEHRYILRPGAQFLELETKVHNRSGDDLEFPKNLLGNEVPTPFGDVILFGAGNKVFIPEQAGFDLRFHLEDIYKAGQIALPAFPGIVSEFIASAGDGVSYGVMTLPPDEENKAKGVQNFAFANKETAFPTATEHSLHVPFIASAFTGVFQVLPPPVLARDDFAPGGQDEVTFRRIFIVGDGDVASISDVVYAQLGDAVGTLEGRVKERQRPQFVAGASVLILDRSGNKVTQASTDANGRFDMTLRPGDYQIIVRNHDGAPTAPVSVTIAAGQGAFEELFVDSPAEVVVTVVEPGVGRVPAKATLVGIYDAEDAGKRPRDFLYDLSIGEPFKYTDLIEDDPEDPSTLQFIEAFDYGHDGVVRLHGRPGRYKLVAGRGTEYDRFETEVVLEAGVTKTVTAEIRRVVNTPGYVGADFHLHTQFSLDSSSSLVERLTSYAGEGVEYAVSTDHNFVVDYAPTVEQLGLTPFINSAVGLELTTIDRGHFNGFPLERAEGTLADGNIASRTYGSFEWALRTPTEIFTDLRKLGKKNPDGTVQPIIVQVNHPRDSILGYFEQYGLSAQDLTVEGQSGLLAPDPDIHPEFNKEQFNFGFDAIEVFNGKRFEFLHTFRVPEDAPRVSVTHPIHAEPRTVCATDTDCGAGQTCRAEAGTGPLLCTRDALSGRIEHVADPVSCCATEVGAVLFDSAPRLCRPLADGTEVEDCGCDADTFAYQIEQDSCTPERRGDVAFPGVIEDWVRLLETGQHVVGTANSDSHEAEKEEPGVPRTYVRVPVDEPAQVLPEHIVAAFNQGDVLMTNGPFVTVSASAGSVDGVGMGGTITAVDDKVKLAIHIETAPWVVPNKVRVYRGDLVVFEEDIPGAGVRDIDAELDGITTDTFLLVEVLGDRSMFPSVIPNEIPPLQFTDVIGSLGASFGFGSQPEALQPALIFVTSPYALTNPIYVDGPDDDAVFTPTRELPIPGDAAMARPGDDEAASSSVNLVRPVAWVPTEEEVRREEEMKAWLEIPVRKRIALSRLPRYLWPSNDPKDIRRVLIQFVKHPE